MAWLKWLVALGLLLAGADAYKALVIGALVTRSHSILAESAADILKEKGFEVTFISYYSPVDTHKKYRTVIIPEIPKSDGFRKFSLKKVNPGILELMKTIRGFIPFYLSKIFENSEAKKILEGKDEKFDIVIITHFDNEFLVGLGERFNCPVVLLATLGMTPFLADISGNPQTTATYPIFLLPFTVNMNLLQRAANTVTAAVMVILGRLMQWPKQQLYYEKLFPEEAARVPLEEAMQRVALVLTNTHPSISTARPLLPSTVEVGGFHVTRHDPLPQDLLSILDAARGGVVYFSMGSVLQSRDMSQEMQRVLLRVLGALPFTVLWKLEEQPPDLPSNIIIRKWMPQTAILAHKNVRLFITHAGLQSLTEAAHYGVPLLAIPIFGDQNYNALAVADRGHGLTMAYTNLTEISLAWALGELLNTDSSGTNKYYKKAKIIQALYHDRPISPRDLLAYHVEHVIRTRGAAHLWPPRLSLAQQLLLDILLLILIVLSACILLIIMTSKLLCRKKCSDDAIKKNS